MAHCALEWLMRANGMRDEVRGARTRTTIADESATRPPDLVARAFRSPCTNRLWVVDSTHVPTWSGGV